MTSSADARALSDDIATFAGGQPHRGLGAVALEVGERDGHPVVVGTVLTPRQAREVRDLGRAHGVTAELVVAADPRSGMEAGWVVPDREVLDLWREPARAGEDMGRQTQYSRSDGPLRSFGEEGEFALVQGPDLAMGWAARADIEAFPTDGGFPWARVARAQENVARRPSRDGVGGEELVGVARAWLGAPYVWGGTTDAGFDCSGLLQRVFSEATGILLPRHTGDQRRVGERIPEGGVRRGDLLFAAPRGQKVGHVLLVTSPDSVLHACRTEHRVIEESLQDNAARYLHQGWRRPVWLGEPPA